MAATNVYVKITPVSSEPVVQGIPVSFSNIQATSTAFSLQAGEYAVECIATTFGTVTLQLLGPDGSSYVTAATAFSANGVAVYKLPSGTYKITIA